jgi:hypothetical protein
MRILRLRLLLEKLKGLQRQLQLKKLAEVRMRPFPRPQSRHNPQRRPAPRKSQLSNAIAPAVPKPNVPQAPLPTTNIPQTAPTSEIKMDSELEYDEQYEQDDDRPWQVTKQTFKEIDNMSPSELEALIENIDANEEWRDLKHTAKVRTAQWIGAIKKADEAPRCQYLKTNGKSCGSPAMKGTNFCYFHGEARTKRQAEEASNLQEVPVLEDRLSLQLAITRLCAQLTSRSIDEKTGRILLAALRLAQKNMGADSTLYDSVS